MSRDIFVQDMPRGILSPADIPDDFEPRPLPFTPSHARAVVARIQPGADFDADGWANIEVDGIDIEVSIPEDEPLMGFALFDRSPDRAAADRLISSILDELDVGAFDTDSDEGLFVPSE